MNPGLFGIPGAAAAAGSAVRLRKPFVGDERFKDAVRLMQTSGTSFKPSRLVAASSRFQGSEAHKAVASNGTLLVAIPLPISGTAEAATSTIYTSPDGITWTGRTLPSSGSWNTVCWTGTRFIAGCTGTTIAWSTDGITWTFGTSVPGAMNQAYGGVFAFKGRVFYYKGQGTEYYDSTDNGATWSAVKNFPISPGLQSKNVIVTSEFIAVCDSSAAEGVIGAARISTDGVNWTTPANVWGGAQFTPCMASRPGLAVALMRAGQNGSGGVVAVVSRDNFATSTVEPVFANISSHTLGGCVVASTTFGYDLGNSFSTPAVGTWGAVNIWSMLGPAPTGNRLYFMLRRTTSDGANQYNSYHLLHTIDGKRWVLEDAVFGHGGANCLQFIAHGSAIAAFTFMWNGSTVDTTLNTRCSMLNLDFEELVYDLPV